MAPATKARRKPAATSSPMPSLPQRPATAGKPSATKTPRQAGTKIKPQPKGKTKAPALFTYRSDGLIRGPLISDTLQTFQGWDLEASKRVNLDRLRQSNSIGAPTQAWLKKICGAISSRFDPAGRCTGTSASSAGCATAR